ncbi:MAG: hypothetical protein GXO40_04730 [Epsilonproteobacteria bacterium]|nr:hypothetical protein [Campylobacterota bacterium]
MMVYDLLLLDNIYKNIAVIGDKEVYEYLKSRVDPAVVDIEYIDDFSKYPHGVRIYHRVINAINDVDYNQIFRSIEHDGWLVTMPNIYEESLLQRLEDSGFVALNQTEDHITARRMHGWSCI